METVTLGEYLWIDRNNQYLCQDWLYYYSSWFAIWTDKDCEFQAGGDTYCFVPTWIHWLSLLQNVNPLKSTINYVSENISVDGESTCND